MTLPRAKRRAARPAQIARAVDEGRESLDLYLDEISRVPLLNREEEMELARKAFRGNVAAQEKLARHNVRFVVSVAKKFQNRGVPLVDLIGEGNLGLMTAARKFDPDRGVKFISYAVWWIRQAVQAAIARHGRPVRVPLNRTADLSRLGSLPTTTTCAPTLRNRAAVARPMPDVPPVTRAILPLSFIRILLTSKWLAKSERAFRRKKYGCEGRSRQTG